MHAADARDATAASQRVATLYQGATDIVVALGVKPAAVVESWSERPTYRYLRDALKGSLPLGLETQPSLEDLIYLRPTLIVGSRFRHARIEPLLARIAPTLMLDDVYDFRTGMREIGRAIGRSALADRLLAAFADRTAQLRTRLAASFGARWPLTVSVLDFRDDHVRAYLENSYSGLILGQLGFARMPVQRGPTRVMEKLVSAEQIPVADADVFFVLQRSGSAQVQRTLRAWQAHPLWTTLRAPREGLVFPVDNVSWSLAGGFQTAHKVLDDVERVLLT
ncbi:iron-siderophore ABC transporter substrate-binding protein [Pigmentiphaga aceris]|uniref:Iron-siderophore ABC transporter substrate-binding protein n=1 Tax=Pigmentiphaga aceris TaxID=1940612 RepID=A0A5C0B3Y2_9BURK|nr:iron-siderophore ABC transporter substrate-binding protein [Pigmentiphaga aceris]